VDEKDPEKKKEILFRDIKLCIVPQIKIETEMKFECCAKFNFPFLLFYNSTKIEFFAQSSQEREIFVLAFQYAFHLT
jgi:hypothetical protein